MEITRVDAHDDAALTAWHAAYTEAMAFERPDPPVWSLEEIRVGATHESPTYLVELYAAVRDGRVLGAGQIEMPTRDNLTLAEIEISVPPAFRRQGVGSAMLAALEARAAENGRTSLLTAVQQPVGIPDVAGVGFAAKHGFTKRNTEMRRTLPLPVPAEHLDALEAKSASRAADYRLESWAGPCPDEYAEEYAHLKSLLMTDAPTGDMDYEAEVWDVERLRADESKTLAQGRDWLTTVAVASDGSLAGHTQIGVPAHERRTFQWDTLVLEAHRGHRLGLALKVANLRELARHVPDAKGVETWNAVQNGPMVAVNEELGFRPVEEFQEWQRG